MITIKQKNTKSLLFTLCLALNFAVPIFSARAQKKITVNDCSIFNGTRSEKLIDLIKQNDIAAVNGLLKNDPNLINVPDPYFGSTALMWIVKFSSVEMLNVALKKSVDVNVVAKTGETALIRAINRLSSVKRRSTQLKMIEKLLEHGANPNLVYCSESSESTDPIECGTSPLMLVASQNLKATKILLNAGAELNYKTKSGKTAATEALLAKRVEISKYLIADKEALISEPYFYYALLIKNKIQFNEPHYPVDLLLSWVFPLDSKKHKQKLLIVEAFIKQGEDYQQRKENLNNRVQYQIKKLYPDSWKDYIKSY